MSGLFAGLQLRRRGFAVDIYERVDSELAGRGAGIVAQPAVHRALRELGISTDGLGVEMTTRKILDAEGRIVIESQCPQTLTAWERLYRLLRDAFPAAHYHRGIGLKHFEQDADTVVAHFSDSSEASADLLVGADGIRSTVRAQYWPLAQPVYAGYVAWRAVLDEQRVPRDIWQEIFELYTFCLPPGEQLLAYPVPGRDNDTAVGRRGYNIVWYRPVAPHDLADLLTDAEGQHHAAGIPPPLIRPDVIARVKADARAVLAPQIAEIFARTEPFFQPIYDLESSQIVFGRVALAGDAAFVARPHVGAGATKAAIDAASLADSLGGDLHVGLARYQRAQLPFGRAMVALGREEGEYLSAQIKPKEQRTAAERHRDIHSVLHAHGTRSDQVGQIVTARGLERICDPVRA